MTRAERLDRKTMKGLFETKPDTSRAGATMTYFQYVFADQEKLDARDNDAIAADITRDVLSATREAVRSQAPGKGAGTAADAAPARGKGRTD